MDVFVHTVSRHAAQQIHFICPRSHNQDICILYSRLFQYLHGSAVSVHCHNVVLFYTCFQHLLAGINESQVMALGAKLPCQRSSYFPVSRNNDLHLSFLRVKKLVIKAIIAVFNKIAMLFLQNNPNLTAFPGTASGKTYPCLPPNPGVPFL